MACSQRGRRCADIDSAPAASAARAAAFFSSRAEQHPPGSAEHGLYRELAAEEREHADLLSTEYERWRAGKPGLFDIGPPAVTAPSTELINAAALLLQGHAAERAALCCGERTMSYGELRDRVARAATAAPAARAPTRAAASGRPRRRGCS